MNNIPETIESDTVITCIRNAIKRYKGQELAVDVLFETACSIFSVSQDTMLEILGEDLVF